MILELFNLTHILYISISTALIIGILIVAKVFVKTQKSKNAVFAAMTWGTFVIHMSILWVNFLSTGGSPVYDYMLFPIYFCNLNMYLLVVLACLKNKEATFFKILSTFVAYGGIYGGVITILYPDIYLGGTFNDWNVTKSLVSHSTMILACLYLFVGGFVKIRVKNIVSYSIGLVGAGLIGLAINVLFAACGLAEPNAMYLQHPPIADVPFLNAYVIGLIMLVLIFVFAALWEQTTIKDKQLRWYKNKFKDFVNFKD